MLEKADSLYNSGDEENAYIFYGRYLKILTTIQKNSNYEKHKDYIKSKLGGNTEQKNVMEKMEFLNESLRKKYESKKLQNDKNHAKDEILPVAKSEIRSYVTCPQLYEMMEKESSKFLIIDCRPEDQFQESKIVFNFQCNVPENLCCIGMTVGKIQQKLPNESKVFWEMRKNRPIIVFVDWFSKSFVRNSPIWQLKNILMDWDQDVEKKPEIIILEGGFDQWLTTYPMKCTNPRIKPPFELNTKMTPSVDDIEYPNVDDIIMKDQSMTKSTLKIIPSIDRSTKNNAIKSYENQNYSQSDLLELKEQLINKSIKNNMEIIKLENNYSNILNESDSTENQSKLDLLYRIYEMRTKQKDVDLENESIDEELKNIQNKSIKPSEKSKIEDLEYRLKLKAEEQSKIKQEAELKNKFREEALEKARQNKPKFEITNKLSAIKTELILSPKNLNQNVSIPLIDRSSKPSNIYNQHYYDNQDFSPAYGKVVRNACIIIIKISNHF